jgi:cytochrome b pre-mRNA-processing protein 3
LVRIAALFGRDPRQDDADRLYAGIVARAREPVFYSELEVPDTVDGRFELVALHAFLVLQRLKAERAAAKALAQAVFDLMFADFDRALREMGTGDLSVGKEVRRMAEAFYGRVAAYERALADARAQAQATMKETSDRLAAQAAERQRQANEKLARQVAEAEQRIAAARDAALANVRNVSVDVARAAVSRLVGADIDENRAVTAVDAVMKERA